MQGKNIFRLIYLLILAGLITNSCQKAGSIEPKTDDYILPGEICNLQASINGDTAFDSGKRLKLKGQSSGNRETVSYEWTLPSGETREGQELNVYDLLPSDSGAYIVTAKDGDDDCYAQAVVFVHIIPATPNCTPADNTIKFNSKVENYPNIFCGVGDSYSITATGTNNVVRVVFAEKELPVVGKQYTVKQVSSYEELEHDNVFIEISENSGAKYYSNGSLYVTMENDIPVFTFCNGSYRDAFDNIIPVEGRFSCQ